MARLELVTECEHGHTQGHNIPDRTGGAWCDGGSRTPLDPNLVVRKQTWNQPDFTVQDVLDALDTE